MTQQDLVQVTNASQVLAQLSAVDRKVRTKTIRRGTNASGKVVLDTLKQRADAIRVTGFTRRSLKSVSKSKNGATTVRVGQEKQKQFKLRKSARVGGRNLSQIQRAGKAVPIHWIERGTKPHTIRAAGKGNTRTYSAGSNFLVFQAVARRRGNKGLAFAKSVRNPGMGARRILERTIRLSRSKESAAFIAVAREDLRNVRG